MEVMKTVKTVEKRDYIHSHLHQTDESFINEMYLKMHSAIEKNDPVVGYDASGKPIRRTQFIADIKEAEAQIERGEYVTLDELIKESKTW